MNAFDHSGAYPASAYDNKLNLKPSIGMWLVIVFLLKPYLVMLVSLANRSNRTELISLVYDHSGVLAMAELAALPALAVVIAWVKRNSGASRIIRWIWNNGRSLLILSTLFNVAILAISTEWRVDEFGFFIVLQMILSAFVLFYLWRSDRVRDTFNDFPPI